MKRKITQDRVFYFADLGLAKEMKRMRKSRRIKQQDLAKEIGCNRLTIYRIEKGDYFPVTETLVMYAKAIGFPLPRLKKSMNEFLRNYIDYIFIEGGKDVRYLGEPENNRGK